MNFELLLLIAFSVVFLGLGITLVIARRRVAENAIAAGVKGWSSPGAVAASGGVFIAFSVITPVVVLWLNPHLASS